MNCPNCGTANLDNATLCIQCGRPLSAAAPAAQASYTPPPPPSPSYAPPRPAGGYPDGGPVQPQIPNYLVQSILVTICCCLPLGVVAIIFAAQVNSKLAAGDIAGAQEASNKAKLFCWIALAIGLVTIAVSMMFNGMALLQGFRDGMAQ